MAKQKQKRGRRVRKLVKLAFDYWSDWSGSLPPEERPKFLDNVRKSRKKVYKYIDKLEKNQKEISDEF
jgi:hypothetical protein